MKDLSNPFGKSKTPNQPKRVFKRPLGTLELVDAAFTKTITIHEGSATRRASVLEAIFTQLLHQELAGDKKAAAVRLRYQSSVIKENDKEEVIFEFEYADWVVSNDE